MTNANTDSQSETMPTKTLVGIVVALPEEISTLTKQKLTQSELFRLNENCLIIFAGAGISNAERAANSLISHQATALLSWGCAAALSPELKSGDCVMPSTVIAENQQHFASNALWLKSVQEKLNKHIHVIIGTLLESSVIIAGSQEKQALFANTRALALDMETAAVYRVAHQAGLPCLAIRTIADTAAFSLPDTVAKALNANGQVDIVKLLMGILLKPQQIPALIQLGLHFHAAQKTLKHISQYLDAVVDFNLPTTGQGNTLS